MISKKEHNYIVDTLIKRIEQLENQLELKEDAIEVFNTLNNKKAIQMIELKKQLEAKDKIIEMFANTKDKKQQHLDKLRTEHELLKLDYEVLVNENKELKKEGK